MIFQKILKGIAGVDEAGAKNLFAHSGIICNWWRNDPDGLLQSAEIPDRLTEENLLNHLTLYSEIDPATGRTYSHDTPFISTTAGAVERDAHAATNFVHRAFITALRFATTDFVTAGAIFYGYVYVLGKKALPLQEFAEETRDLNLFHDYQPFHPEGEIAAKIAIPSTRLEKAEIYDGPTALADIRDGAWPRSILVANSRYQHPEQFSNVRDFIP